MKLLGTDAAEHMVDHLVTVSQVASEGLEVSGQVHVRLMFAVVRSGSSAPALPLLSWNLWTVIRGRMKVFLECARKSHAPLNKMSKFSMSGWSFFQPIPSFQIVTYKASAGRKWKV